MAFFHSRESLRALQALVIQHQRNAAISGVGGRSQEDERLRMLHISRERNFERGKQVKPCSSMKCCGQLMLGSYKHFSFEDP